MSLSILEKEKVDQEGLIFKKKKSGKTASLCVNEKNIPTFIWKLNGSILKDYNLRLLNETAWLYSFLLSAWPL